MFDRFNRSIDYLRISVTDRCNLRCTYCVPSGDFRWIPHDQILSFEEMAEVTREAVSLGVYKVRITGGEPLVRKGITGFVRMLAEIPGIDDLSMTTNGILLAGFARELKQAGLMRVNISLDTLDPFKFAEITGGGELQSVLKGIEAVLNEGFAPVKINCVVHNSGHEPDALDVAAFALEMGLQIRFIPQMDLSSGYFGIVEGGEGGNCRMCNRIRLTANGFVKPCLFSDLQYSVRDMGIRQALLMAVQNKPQCGSHNHTNSFHNIGG